MGEMTLNDLISIAITVSDDAKLKILKKQRKAELSRRMVCKSLPAEM